MKKQNLQLKLNLKKQTVTDLNTVQGGAVRTLPTEMTCESVVKCEFTQADRYPCCPGCRSGYNATMVKELCETVMQSIEMNKTCTM